MLLSIWFLSLFFRISNVLFLLIILQLFLVILEFIRLIWRRFVESLLSVRECIGDSSVTLLVLSLSIRAIPLPREDFEVPHEAWSSLSALRVNLLCGSHAKGAVEGI